MKPPGFTYHDPSTLDELLSMMSSLEDARLLAGGQSLMPVLNMRLAHPEHVVDLNTVVGLDGVESTETGVLIGAMARQSTLISADLVTSRLPVMAEALGWVGHFQTRNRGTLGGSLSHLDPAAELPAVALLHDAVLTVESQTGSRTVPIAEWAEGYMTPNLTEHEVLTSIEFQTWSEPHGYAFEEYARRYGDFAIVAVGALLAIRDGTITRAAVAVAGLQSTPSRLADVETSLVGQPAAAPTYAAAGELARGHEAMTDSYFDGRYRQRLAGVLTARALQRAAARSGSER
ncbi:MAG: FAD binding domain-containing protein [Acidimicrobiales bacterium]